jgi:hypothetical protein
MFITLYILAPVLTVSVPFARHRLTCADAGARFELAIFWL